MSAPANRYASLRRAAEESPDSLSAKADAIKQKLLDLADQIENFQNHMDMTPESKEKFAGLRTAAEDEPEEVEMAIQDFYLGLDEVMAETEALADEMGVSLDIDAGEEGDGDDGAIVEIEGTVDADTLRSLEESSDEDSAPSPELEEALEGEDNDGVIRFGND